jgi:hypothetical protein
VVEGSVQIAKLAIDEADTATVEDEIIGNESRG